MSKLFKKVKYFSPTKQIALSFLFVIFLGSLLLTLPISNNGNNTTYINHLFIATSATCVTGLVPVVVSEQYSLFGQIVIILLIQIGGLGFLTLLNMMVLIFEKKINFSSKLIMQEALNIQSIKEVSFYIKKVIKYTLFFELLGALLLSFVFVDEFGLLKGIYYSLFHSISAFCNAGFDVLGNNSLINYQTNILISLVISGLIIAGGLGFVVWVDLFESLNKYKEKFKIFKFNKFIASLKLQTKLAILMSVFLLISGTFIILLLEINNPLTLKSLTLPEQLLVSFFQSTTLRTAGFASVDMASLYDSTKLFMSILMFIGGSPAGTAGGIKTVTILIIILYIRSLMKGHQNVNIFKRTIDNHIVKSALTITIVSFLISIFALFLLSISEKALFIDLIFEVYSAFATVGLSASLTPVLTDFGKVIVILLMYIGRIGPMTMVLLFTKKYHQMKGKDITYAHEDVLVG